MLSRIRSSFFKFKSDKTSIINFDNFINALVLIYRIKTVYDLSNLRNKILKSYV